MSFNTNEKMTESSMVTESPFVIFVLMHEAARHRDSSFGPHWYNMLNRAAPAGCPEDTYGALIAYDDHIMEKLPSMVRIAKLVGRKPYIMVLTSTDDSLAAIFKYESTQRWDNFYDWASDTLAELNRLKSTDKALNAYDVDYYARKAVLDKLDARDESIVAKQQDLRKEAYWLCSSAGLESEFVVLQNYKQAQHGPWLAPAAALVDKAMARQMAHLKEVNSRVINEDDLDESHNYDSRNEY